MKTFLTTIAAVSTLIWTSMTWSHPGHTHPPLSGHLTFKNDTVHVHAKFPTKPTTEEESILVLETRDAKTHKTIELADTIEVELWMPSMGHGSAPTQLERALDVEGQVILGTYNVRNVYFIMPGLWQVFVKLTDADGATETQNFEVTIDGDHGGHH